MWQEMIPAYTLIDCTYKVLQACECSTLTSVSSLHNAHNNYRLGTHSELLPQFSC